MTEAFLHYIWQYQYFDKTGLVTTAGDPVAVYAPGIRNRDAGPDFFNARVRIQGMDWVGNVEIHIHASGWDDHHHDEDPAYDNVILHVVWNDDQKILRRDQSVLPTVELKHRVAGSLLLRYRDLMDVPDAIPCAGLIGRVNELTRVSAIHSALMQRLQERATRVAQLLEKSGNSWEETCYHLIVRNFGFKVNHEPFGQLARAIPYRILLKHADQLLQVEALLFGQAGFLEEVYDNGYYNALQREHRLLAKKYAIEDKKLMRSQWRFLRLRPANFPTLRIAQLAALLAGQKNIFSKMMDASAYDTLVKLFAVRQSDYWQYHYRFGDGGREAVPSLGSSAVENLIINSVVPLLVAYGRLRDEQRYVDRAIDVLEHIPCERNKILRTWEALGVRAFNAADSQGLIELYNNFCLKRRCLDCNIGFAIMEPHP